MTYNVSADSQKMKNKKTDDTRTNRDGYDNVFFNISDKTINKKQSDTCACDRQHRIGKQDSPIIYKSLLYRQIVKNLRNYAFHNKVFFQFPFIGTKAKKSISGFLSFPKTGKDFPYMAHLCMFMSIITVTITITITVAITIAITVTLMI